MQTVSTNKRMAKNTIAMYIRMLVIIVVQLYTVPIVLHALGVEDYGIYNVVGGFVIMFTFINGSLVSGCERFMAYAIGREDKQNLKEVFDSTLLIFAVLSILLFIIIEIAGIWFLNNRMNIPENRSLAANWILQMSIIALFFTILRTPYNALVIAHERMSVYAYTSIFESLYKLGVAFCLTVIANDKLITYAILIAVSSLLLALFYVIYCKIQFYETRGWSFQAKLSILKMIGGYAGWNTLGSLAIMLRNHGLNVVMNLFFTPVMNAAHAIAAQITGVFSQFVDNVYIATRPQMVKLYARNDTDEMWKVVFKSSKLAFFLLVYIFVPTFIELPSILEIWLKVFPAYTVIFCRFILLSLAIETMVNQIIGAFQAANRIKAYQSVSSIILLFVVPLSYLILHFISNPVIPYAIYVLVSMAYLVSLLTIAHKQLKLNVISYIREVILRDILVIMPSLLITYCVISMLDFGYLRILVTALLSFIISTILIWTLGFENDERVYVRSFVLQKIRRKE